jgi:hypothetical protein
VYVCHAGSHFALAHPSQLQRPGEQPLWYRLDCCASSLSRNIPDAVHGLPRVPSIRSLGADHGAIRLLNEMPNLGHT